MCFFSWAVHPLVHQDLGKHVWTTVMIINFRKYIIYISDHMSSYPKLCWFKYIIHPHGARRSLNTKPATQRTIVVGRIFCSSLVELFWVNLGYIDRK